jgi:hypothetical protein
MMDGWHGDEDICTGNCGMCDACEELRLQRGDNEYEAYKQEQIDEQFFNSK